MTVIAMHIIGLISHRTRLVGVPTICLLAVITHKIHPHQVACCCCILLEVALMLIPNDRCSVLNLSFRFSILLFAVVVLHMQRCIRSMHKMLVYFSIGFYTANLPRSCRVS